MGLAHEVAKKIGNALRPARAGNHKLAAAKLGVTSLSKLDVSSTAFSPGGALPFSATADGAGTPPPIAWKGIPGNARSLVLLCEDPDAPFPNPFVHWLVYGIPAHDGALDAAALRIAREGENSKIRNGYTGAAPPPGHGEHRYHFQVFALDVDVPTGSGAGRSSILEAMRGHVLAWGEIVGTYRRE